MLALVSNDVDWPDVTGKLHGKGEVCACWIEPWARTRTHDEPVSFTELNDGRNADQISQVVRSLDGSVNSKGQVRHVHRIEGDHVSRLDIELLPNLRLLPALMQA